MHNLWPEIVRMVKMFFICRLSTYQCLDCSPSAEIVVAAITNFQIITLFFEFILIQFIPATRFNIIYEF